MSRRPLILFLIFLSMLSCRTQEPVDMDNIPDRVKFPSELNEEEVATPLIINPKKQAEAEARTAEVATPSEPIQKPAEGFSGTYAIAKAPSQVFTVIDQEDLILFINPRKDTFQFIPENDSIYRINANSAEGIGFRPASDDFDLVLINSKGGKTVAKRID